MKGKLKIILTVTLAIMCIALVIVLIFNGSTDGHYVAKEYEAIGVTFYIDLKGNNYEMVATSQNLDGSTSENRTTGSFKIKEDIITLEFEGSEITGSYNEKDKAITVNGITFSKE